MKCARWLYADLLAQNLDQATSDDGCDVREATTIKRLSLRLASHLAQSVGPGRRRGLGEGAKPDALDRRY